MLSFHESLADLSGLSVAVLDRKSRRIRKSLADAEWKMGLCLLAMVRTSGFRKLGYATISEYGEKVLSLSGKKLAQLLGTARALEHLPLLSQAFREGKVGWGKVRALQSLATPETEQEWLDFALVNTVEAVVKKVSLSPKQWKRQRALEASLRQEPLVKKEDVRGILGAKRVVAAQPRTLNSTVVVPEAKCVVSQSQPAKIRVVVEMSPDQFALYEAAERRVRAQEGKRIGRAEVVTRMAETVLAQGTSRARARHQVVIHHCDGCRKSWYETGAGVHSVKPEVLQEAVKKSDPLRVDAVIERTLADSSRGEDVAKDKKSKANRPKDTESDSQEIPRGDFEKAKRDYIPTATVRALFARAANRCERCGARAPRLDIHHTTPVCEGGGSLLEDLKLYCRACHTLHHERDFESKPVWQRAKLAATERVARDALSARRGGLGVKLEETPLGFGDLVRRPGSFANRSP